MPGISADIGGGSTAPKPKRSGGGGILGDIGDAVHFVEHTGGQTVEDLYNMAVNIPAGSVALARGLYNNPVGTIEQQGQAFVDTLRHPLRHPGYTLANLGLLATGVGGVLGRVGEASAIAARGGALPAELATNIGRLQEATPELGASVAAKQLGQGGAFTRALTPVEGAGGISWVPKPVGAQIRSSLIHGLPKQERLLTTTGESPIDTLLATPAGSVYHGWWYSRNPVIRKAQKLVDEAHNRFPDSSETPIWRLVNGRLFSSQSGRIMAASKKLATITAHDDAKAGALFLKKWGKVGDAMHMAARIVGEGYTPDELIKMHSDILTSGVLKNQKFIDETLARIPLIKEAATMLEPKDVTVTDSAGVTRTERVMVPKPGETELQNLVNDARELSNKRTIAGRLSGVLSEESHFGRTVGPLNYVRYGEIPERLTRLLKVQQGREAIRARPDISPESRIRNEQKLAELSERIARAKAEVPGHNPIVGEHAEALVRQAGLFRVPYDIERPSLKSFGATAFRRPWQGGKKAPPTTFTHQFQAGILKHGGGSNNIAKLLAESYTEAHRYIAFQKNRDRILASGQKTPQGIDPKYRVMMATNDHITARMPARRAEEYAVEHDPRDILGAAKQYEDIRSNTFPVPSVVMNALHFTQDQIHNLLHGESGFKQVPGYVWVDKRTLGGLDKQNPLLGVMDSPRIRGVIHLTDAINNAQKMAILYLKPSYALPNMGGNLFLNLIQQGAMAPANLAKSVFASRTLDNATLHSIDGVMGEGFSESLRPSGFSGHVTHTGNRLAGFYGRFVDTPFRRASFFHEARLDGFVTNDQLRMLTTDDRFAQQFHDIANRANDEIIQYEGLNPSEQAILRRLIFFYPWIKGSTKYTIQSLKEHPVAMGALGVAGQEGTRTNEAFFGALPSFAEGLIPYGKKNARGIAQVGNPASLAIFQQPAEIGKAIASMVERNPNTALSLLGNLGPSESGGLSLLSLGALTTVPHPSSWSPLKVAGEQFWGTNPAKLFYENVTGGPTRPNSLYPDNSFWHAFLRYAATGGLTPRDYNVAKGFVTHWKETHPPKFTGGGL